MISTEKARESGLFRAVWIVGGGKLRLRARLRNDLEHIGQQREGDTASGGAGAPRIAQVPSHFAYMAAQLSGLLREIPARLADMFAEWGKHVFDSSGAGVINCVQCYERFALSSMGEMRVKAAARQPVSVLSLGCFRCSRGFSGFRPAAECASASSARHRRSGW